MKAKIHPRIRLEGRPVLQEVIPLDTPFIINVDPSDRCTLRCNFCPTGDDVLMKQTMGRNHGPMDLDLFKKIVDDIAKFPKPLKVLRLYKDGEPLVNRHFADMVRYAKASGRIESVDTTTNATLLNPARNVEIIESGIDRINISIYGMNADRYEKFTKRRIDFAKLVEGIKNLYEISRGKCIIHVKINADVISQEEEKLFYETFGDICDEIFAEHIMSCWPQFDFGGHGIKVNEEMGIYGQLIKENLTCPYIFYSFSINSDGTCSTCFLDWGRKLLIGDVKTQGVVDIWKGIQMETHRLMMLRGERKGHHVCGNCGQMTHGCPDNLDPFREKLLASSLIQSP